MAKCKALTGSAVKGLNTRWIRLYEIVSSTDQYIDLKNMHTVLYDMIQGRLTPHYEWEINPLHIPNIWHGEAQFTLFEPNM